MIRGGTAARDRLIVALDVADAGEADALVDRLGDVVTFYKIGLHLQLAPQLHSIIAKLVTKKKHVFLDFKYFDIPATVAGAVRMAAALEVRFLTVMGQRRIVEAALTARDDAGVKILAVTLLTGTSQDEMRQEFDTALSLEEFVGRRAAAAARAGADGVISSPNEIRSIRAQSLAPGFLVVTPGIRPAGAPPDDQRRTATPYEAVRCGADYLVVGRPILRAADPRDAASRIIGEIGRALAADADPVAQSQP